ncbi:hypothetical protein EBO15_06695 [Actinomadura harenae]|uniref:Uncharacterized protein n=1 Tax=Actinomadura harenae TaxID=2483351 RepID=A0A3M2MH76_9ACTN|nr:hypothetical protein EBO15_06695 [Actinomadura harenae]
MIGAAGIVGSATVVAVGSKQGISADGVEALLSDRQRAVILAVAKAGARVPVRFPDFGEDGTPESRADEARLDQAVQRLDAERAKHVAAGADALLARGADRKGRARLLAEIGRLSSDYQHRTSVEAVAALAIATVSSAFDPNSSHPAQMWVGGLRHLGERGEQPLPVQHLEDRR